MLYQVTRAGIVFIVFAVYAEIIVAACHIASGGQLSAPSGGSQQTQMSFNSNSQLKSVSGSGSRADFQYDNQSQLKISSYENQQTHYYYDARGKLYGTIHANIPIRVVRLYYNTIGQVARIASFDINSAPKNSAVCHAFSQLLDADKGAVANRERIANFKHFTNMLDIEKRWLNYNADYHLDNKNRLLRVGLAEGNIRFSYPDRWHIERSLPNNIVSRYTYNSDGLLSELTHKKSDGQLIARYQYQYNEQLKLKRLTEQAGNNRPIITRYNSEKQSIDYRYSETGQLLAVGGDKLSWDERNNLRSLRGTRSYRISYNARNFPQAINANGSSVRFAWSANGDLVSIARNRRDRSYYLPHPLLESVEEAPLMSIDRKGRRIKSYIYAGGLIAVRDKRQNIRFFLEDGFGRVRYTVDQQGTLVSKINYTAFNQPQLIKGNVLPEFTLPGKRYLPQYGLYMTKGLLHKPGVGKVNRAPSYTPVMFNRYHNRHTRKAWDIIEKNLRTGMPKNIKDREAYWTSGQYRNDPYYQAIESINPPLELARDLFNSVAVMRPIATVGMSYTGVVGFMLDLGGLNLSTISENLIRAMEEHGATTQELAHARQIHNNLKLGERAYGVAMLAYGVGDIALDPPKKWILLRVPRMKNVETIEPKILTPEQLVLPADKAIILPKGTLFTVSGNKIFKKADIKLPQQELVLVTNANFFKRVQPGAMPRDYWKGLKVDEYFKYVSGSEVAEKDLGLAISRKIGEYVAKDIADHSRSKPQDKIEAPNNLSVPIAQAHNLGGVSLDSKATAIDFPNIVSAVFDPLSRKLILIGDDSLNIPPVELPSLAIALLAKERARPIQFSLDPADRTNPSGKWLRAVYRPEFVAGSLMGQKMLDADLMLKQYSFQVEIDQNNKIVARESSVVEYKSIPELMFSLNSDYDSGKNRWTRYWISPDKIVLHHDDNGIYFAVADMKIDARRQIPDQNSPTGLMDIDVDDPISNEFKRRFNLAYDEIAVEAPEFEQVRQLAKICALADWMYKRGIKVDRRWLFEQVNQRESYVDKVNALSVIKSRTKREPISNGKRRGVRTSTQEIHLFGGVNLSVEPIYIPDTRSVEPFSQALANALQQNPGQNRFKLDVAGKSYQAVVLSLQ